MEKLLEEPKARIVLRLPEQTKRAIHARAAAKGMTVVDYVTELHTADVQRAEKGTDR